MQFRARVTAAATLGLVAVATAQSIVAVPWPTPSKIPLNITLGYGTVNSTGTRFNWYIAVLDDLSRFSVQLPTGGCGVRSTTTTTSNLYTCSAAVNAGFFSFSPNANGSYCMGELVVNGSIEAWDGDGDAMLSVTADNTTLIGALTTEQVKSLKVTYGVNGFGSIVKNGQPDVEGVARMKQRMASVKASRGVQLQPPTAGSATRRSSSGARPAAEETAPRTVAGVDADGRLMLVAIDGVEALYMGLTTDELTDVMSGGSYDLGFPFKFLHAINLDGGGSTTMSTSPSYNTNVTSPAIVFNRPTNTDVGPISERNVTSIMCISG